MGFWSDTAYVLSWLVTYFYGTLIILSTTFYIILGTSTILGTGL